MVRFIVLIVYCIMPVFLYDPSQPTLVINCTSTPYGENSDDNNSDSSSENFSKSIGGKKAVVRGDSSDNIIVGVAATVVLLAVCITLGAIIFKYKRGTKIPKVETGDDYKVLQFSQRPSGGGSSVQTINSQVPYNSLEPSTNGYNDRMAPDICQPVESEVPTIVLFQATGKNQTPKECAPLGELKEVKRAAAVANFGQTADTKVLSQTSIDPTCRIKKHVTSKEPKDIRKFAAGEDLKQFEDDESIDDETKVKMEKSKHKKRKSKTKSQKKVKKKVKTKAFV